MTVLGYQAPAQVWATCERCSGLGSVISIHGYGLSARHLMPACPSCNGQGVIFWSRGISLPPLIPRRR